jgi:hypothetical protein
LDTVLSIFFNRGGYVSKEVKYLIETTLKVVADILLAALINAI